MERPAPLRVAFARFGSAMAARLCKILRPAREINLVPAILILALAVPPLGGLGRGRPPKGGTANGFGARFRPKRELPSFRDQA
jgi:hypothetical protein